MDGLDLAGVEVDFSKASFTAIVSDLHLCEAEPPHSQFPLWKKYKTVEFFFDQSFRFFVDYIDQQAQGDKVELILNGDTFDFDSVCQIPSNPIYRVTWLERKGGLDPEENKSVDKINTILDDHQEWCQAMAWFVGRGHRVVFVIGNHDLELHWRAVQVAILDHLDLTVEQRQRVRFVEWFYISNGDTLVEHGNQYDPYCMCDDPVNPFVVEYNRIQVRLPFGDWACRYLTNNMGFFNPHSDSNYLMSVWGYVKVFFRYMVVAQPLILWTWFWTSIAIFMRTVYSHFKPPLSNPLTLEERIEGIGKRANGNPRMVRELRELFSVPAAASPVRILKELYLDRAFLVIIALFLLLQIFVWIKQIFAVSIFWMFCPILLLIPPFLLYSRSIDSYVALYKKPQERILTTAGLITQTNRIIYGHTHEVRHEVIGGVEHLNSGTWSPAFADIECRNAEDTRTFIWITPGAKQRRAQVLQVKGNEVRKFW